MIIDSHQHFWDLARGDYGWLTPETNVLYRNYLPEDLVGILEQSGIRATVLVQAAPTEAETAYLLELSDAHPFIAGVVGWANFESNEAPEQIAALTDRGQGKLKGLRPMIQDIPDSAWVARAELDAAFEAMVSNDLIFDALVKPMHLNALLDRLLRHPNLESVLDHCGKPDIEHGGFDTWATSVERLARETNIHCKLSGLLTVAGSQGPEAVAPYVAHIFSCFGPGRIVWGSDWPVLNSVSDYARWLSLSNALVKRWAPTQTDDVMAKNARRLYRLRLA